MKTILRLLALPFAAIAAIAADGTNDDIIELPVICVEADAEYASTADLTNRPAARENDFVIEDRDEDIVFITGCFLFDPPLVQSCSPDERLSVRRITNARPNGRKGHHSVQSRTQSESMPSGTPAAVLADR